MSVQREKLIAVARLMPQDHDRTVVLRHSIVRQNVNYPVQRRMQRCTRLDEKIDAQMNRSAFLYGVLHAAERGRTVERPRFVVSPNSYSHGGALHFAKYFFREGRSF